MDALMQDVDDPANLVPPSTGVSTSTSAPVDVDVGPSEVPVNVVEDSEDEEEEERLPKMKKKDMHDLKLKLIESLLFILKPWRGLMQLLLVILHWLLL